MNTTQMMQLSCIRFADVLWRQKPEGIKALVLTSFFWNIPISVPEDLILKNVDEMTTWSDDLDPASI